jgi:lipopolysaccharide transport system ATP-binding protein
MKNVCFYYLQKQGYFRYRRYLSLQDISFDLYKAETLALIGRNGAGKTTLMKLMSGIFVPDKGEFVNHGYKTALLSLQTGFIPYLTGRENAQLGGITLGVRRSHVLEQMESIKEFSGLGDYFEMPIKSYSTGMRARLGFAVSFLLAADIFCIDEVLGVGDAEFKQRSHELMKQKISSDKTVVLCSHSLPVVEELADRVLWIENGKMQALGAPKDVIREYTVFMQTKEQKRKASKG